MIGLISKNLSVIQIPRTIMLVYAHKALYKQYLFKPAAEGAL